MAEQLQGRWCCSGPNRGLVHVSYGLFPVSRSYPSENRGHPATITPLPGLITATPHTFCLLTDIAPTWGVTNASPTGILPLTISLTSPDTAPLLCISKFPYLGCGH